MGLAGGVVGTGGREVWEGRGGGGACMICMEYNFSEYGYEAIMPHSMSQTFLVAVLGMPSTWIVNITK